MLEELTLAGKGGALQRGPRLEAIQSAPRRSAKYVSPLAQRSSGKKSSAGKACGDGKRSPVALHPGATGLPTKEPAWVKASHNDKRGKRTLIPCSRRKSPAG